ncbi:MAG: 4-hydroxy-tetrahydrodipicolinate synthase [Chloroflexota bacterium]|nr:4-hydroxy-tetrahydrodipicolinate synthase [Chloroflexota bacterium]
MRIPTLEGVIPAIVTPFGPDLEVDEDSLRVLIRSVLQPEGITGLVVNGIAGEVDALTRAERERIVAIAVEEVPAGLPVIAGVEAPTAHDARSQVEAAAEAGAAAVLLQAPAAFARGITEAPEVAVEYVTEVGRAGVPIVLFQHQAATQRAYPLPLLLRLLEVPSIVAVKETVWEVGRYEQTVRAIRRERPATRVMLANDTLLLPCMVSAMPDGVLVGFASIAGREIARMWAAVLADRLDEARAIHESLAPLRDAIYASPPLAYYPRAKAALNLLGILPGRAVRSPLIEASAGDVDRVRAALIASGLLGSPPPS